MTSQNQGELLKTPLPDIIKSGESARLLPVLQEKQQNQKEKNLTSTFLATLISVKEYAQTLLGETGVCPTATNKKISFEAWTEIVFKQESEDKKRNRPDGLLIVKTGKKEWKALIEAKVGVGNDLEPDQIKRYISLAKRNGIDALITISNQYTIQPDFHPLHDKIDGRKLGNKNPLPLYHFSWNFIVSQGLIHLKNQTVQDNDQLFILKEFLRFIDKKYPEIISFQDMNRAWKNLHDNIHVKSNDSKIQKEAIASWYEYMRFLSLGLSKDLGVNVSIILPRKYKKPIDYINEDITQLRNNRMLKTDFDVPQAPSKISFQALVEKRTVIASITLPADTSRKNPQTALTFYYKWLIKNEAKDNFDIGIRWKNRSDSDIKFTKFSNLRDEQERKKFLTHDSGEKIMPKEFIIKIEQDLAKDFSQKFVKRTHKILHNFYTQIIQNIERKWTAKTIKEKADND